MFFHGTTQILQPGDRRLSHEQTGLSPWAAIYMTCPGDAWRAGRVWLFDRPEEAGMWVGGWWAGDGRVYQIDPDSDPEPLICDPDDEDGLDYGAPPQWHTTAGAVIAEILAPACAAGADARRRQRGHAPGLIIPVGS